MLRPHEVILNSFEVCQEFGAPQGLGNAALSLPLHTFIFELQVNMNQAC